MTIPYVPGPPEPAQQWQPEPQPPVAHVQPPTKKPSKAPWFIAGAAVLVALALGGVLVANQLGFSPPVQLTSPLEPAAPRQLEDAKNACAASDSSVQLTDGGKTLLIDSEGEEDSGATMDTLVCVLDKLDTPSAVIAEMESTTALSGRQDATWGDLTASWTYHPDNGLDIIVQAQP